MKSSIKITILVIVAALGLGIGLWTQSVGMLAGVVVILLLVGIWLIASSNEENEPIQKQLDNFLQLMQFKRNRLIPMDA